ncbi:MAG: hypothetical protein L0287_14755 [Anaerolineae bacterium]|nr:hypothetical protein [Anaerolineae bacterium]MCI0609878.1 hypothetical protein [Anaerolineae bacterium]
MSNGKRIRLDWVFYILMALGLIALLIWSTMGEIARNPSREAIADLGSYVTVKLQTNPYPALPTGTVGLTFTLIDSRSNIIQPDSLSFEYGIEGRDQPIGSGIAEPMLDGNGTLMAGAQFPSVGTWWLRVNLAKDGYQDEVQFTIEVRPAQ